MKFYCPKEGRTGNVVKRYHAFFSGCSKALSVQFRPLPQLKK